MLVDVLPVLGLAVLAIAPAIRLESVGLREWVLSVLLWLPALARRRRPVAAFLLTAALVLAGMAEVGVGAEQLLFSYSALWFALFSVADRCDGLRTLLAVAACEGVALLTLLGPPTADGAPAVVPLTTFTVAVAVLGRNRQTRRAYTASLEDRAARLERERDQQARVAVAEERARIAREVHDVVAHNISVMIALADGATYATTEPAASTAMAHVATTGRTALTEMSRLLGVLREDDGSPSRRPAPALGDLESLVEQVRAAGLRTDLAVRGTPVPLETTAQLAVYRLVQEALTNTLKHGRGVRRAHVGLTWQPDVLVLDVRDDGAAVGATTPGHGITGMRERFGAWAGTVTAGPADGGGWLVHARLPLAGTRAEPAAEPVAERVAEPVPAAGDATGTVVRT
ncbi:sensor histidine kinase [Modestobacter sp. I12A-02628]|uniref:histidine kinase n=1 Tax=Goekera deserti TaxID=2497753 RepID=A0A7K3WC06_9ACTN|nr:histidine kinase [Goekera deserti]MPQ98429.1 sensor histidine kinase [Goekera deserti]NDI48256.1 sensor histidine kinase [Goekera deserti]NEL54005.1 sensor histidine kinase [Goekera deserti]